MISATSPLSTAKQYSSSNSNPTFSKAPRPCAAAAATDGVQAEFPFQTSRGGNMSNAALTYLASSANQSRWASHCAFPAGQYTEF